MICGNKKETVRHTIFRCRRAKELWMVSQPQVRLFDCREKSKASKIMISAAVRLSVVEFELFCVVC